MISFCEGLSYTRLDTMRSLASGHETFNVPCGEPIFRAGDAGSAMYGLLEGLVRLSWNGGQGPMKTSRRAMGSVPGRWWWAITPALARPWR